jgi:hypothetical protein
MQVEFRWFKNQFNKTEPITTTELNRTTTHTTQNTKTLKRTVFSWKLPRKIPFQEAILSTRCPKSKAKS